jgi:stress response protein SCP2
MASKDSLPLNVSAEPPGRFFVGLAWDGKEPKASIFSVILGLVIDKALFTVRQRWLPVMSARKGMTMNPQDYVSTTRGATQVSRASRRLELMRVKDGTPSKQFNLDLSCRVLDANLRPLCAVTVDPAQLIDPSGKVFHGGDEQSGLRIGDDEQLSVLTHGLPDNYRHFFFIAESNCKYGLDTFRGATMRLVDGKTETVALETKIDPPEKQAPKAYVFCHVFRDGGGWRVRSLDAYAPDSADWDTLLPGLVRDMAA